MAVVTFEDGPAGEPVDQPLPGFELRYEDRLALSLQRLPVFLRVVRDRATGTWDALDQLDDEPRQTEDVLVYVRATYGHARELGRWATYRYVPVPRAVLAGPECRTTDGWRALVDKLAGDHSDALPAYKPDLCLIG